MTVRSWKLDMPSALTAQVPTHTQKCINSIVRVLFKGSSSKFLFVVVAARNIKVNASSGSLSIFRSAREEEASGTSAGNSGTSTNQPPEAIKVWVAALFFSSFPPSPV